MYLGFSEQMINADDISRRLINTHREDINKLLKTNNENFAVVGYKMQEVDGTNFKIKVQVDDGKYIHVLIYRYADEDNEHTEVLVVKTGQTIDSAI